MQQIVFGLSPVFRKLIEQIDDYAKMPWPILLLGETGVGKDLLAQRIHGKSLTPSGPLVTLNCGAIPLGLFESEFFGYERGAFSGAVQSHRGLLRSANGGSVFLDEIGELPLSAQVKLLRWLDSGELRSLGAIKTDHCSARLIAATNVDLPKAVGAGKFRLDLFERLGVLTIFVPPLRDRKQDIVLIAKSVLNAHGVEADPAMLGVLEDFHWPGNVRQLRNVLIRAIARSRGPIELRTLVVLLEEEQYLTEALLRGENHDILDSPLAEIEKHAIFERIRRCRGNKKQAAKELGIAKSTLHDKVRKWKQEVPVHLEEDPHLRDPFSRAVLGA